MGVVADFVKSRFGTNTTVRDAYYVVGTDVIRIAPNSPDRFVLAITNTGALAVAIALDARDYLKSSFILGSGGGSLILDAGEDGELVTHEFYARTLSGTTDIVVTEVVAT